MHSSSNRSILIISGLLTLLVLSGGALALGFHNDWLRSGSGAASPEAIGADSQPDDCGCGPSALPDWGTTFAILASVQSSLSPRVRMIYNHRRVTRRCR